MIKVSPRTKDAYKDKGKIYMFKQISEGFPTEGFAADGTTTPWYFVLFSNILERRDISKYFEEFTFRRNVVEADKWVYAALIKLVFEKKETT